MARVAAASLVLAQLLVRHAESLSWHATAADHALLNGRGCTELTNKGTHFSIDVLVGSPPQTFSVIADTGSNTLIVPSCTCMDNKRCPKTDRCFKGANRSSTFELLQEKSGAPVSMVLSFGSGQVQGVIAKEKVRVGAVEHFMEQGLMLMTDRALQTTGSFEGILGLGVPLPEGATVEGGAPQETDDAKNVPQELQDIIDQIVGGKGLQQPAADDVQSNATDLQEALRQIIKSAGRGVTVKNESRAYGQVNPVAQPMIGGRAPPPGFLEQAKIERFSMCFNDGGNGALRIGTDAPLNTHGGIGKAHWGLDFRGISVGKNNTPAQALFCQPGNLSEGQATPCGAVPDSGTTMLVGPPAHVASLLETICDEWDRCKQNYTALLKAEEKAEEAITNVYGINPFNMRGMTKSDVLQIMMMDCESWMDGGKGLDELPTLHFHVMGSNGTSQTLEISSNAYVMEVPKEKASEAIKFISGVGAGNESIPVNPANYGNNTGKVCQAAFNSIDFNTPTNGPVWILGTPIFYEYVVGYDASTTPPSMAFSSQKDTPCGSCGGAPSATSLLDMRHYQKLRHPRRLRKAPRMGKFDTTQGL